MSRRKKRKRSAAAKLPSTSAALEQPDFAAVPLERLLDIADHHPNPYDALAIYQLVVDQCQHAAAASVFDGAEGCLWEIPDGGVICEPFSVLPLRRGV